MKKRLTFILLAVLLGAAGCSEKAVVVYTCGNGILEADEICDGTQFSENLNLVCSNGATANKSALRCTDKCQLDMSAACTAVCGNGIIEEGEQCDGLAMPTVNAACTNPDLTKLGCQNCRVVDNGICGSSAKTKPAWYAETCGNGQLDTGELCDGDIIASAAKICPANMIPKGNPVYKCLDSCRGVDISGACVFGNNAVCGNGVLEGDEACDGTEFSQEALTSIQCGSGEKINLANMVCNNCQIEGSCVPAVRDDVGMIVTEVVPHLNTSGDDVVFDGFAIELTNMNKVVADTSTCSLALISQSKIEQKFSLADLNAASFDVRETKVLCSLKAGDVFNGACDIVIPGTDIVDNLNVIVEDLMTSGQILNGSGLLGIVCGDDEIVDLVNLNSFIQGIDKAGATDYVRLCDAEPVTEPANALMGEGWNIDASTVGAPNYGLGEHCTAADAAVKYCQYTASRDTLDNRGQSIDLALEINIPGITDKTSGTDADKSLQIQFVAGNVKGKKVSKSIIHYVEAHADTAWQNDKGVDRYVGKLRNWDLYEGFLNMDVGTYTLDASITFDNGNTYYYCGPKGIIVDYSVYDAEQRNTLVVSYDDDGGVCGDGIVSASEVCDGKLARNEALECENTGDVVTDMSKISCSCSTMNTKAACASKLLTCGNELVDGNELCDGPMVPETLRVCPSDMVVKNNPVWHCADSCLSIDVSLACEYPCGNGRLDDGEVCDGTLIDDAAAAAKCDDDTTYDASRATCQNTCKKVDLAACVPNRNLVIDEFLVQRDGNGNALGVAISLNNYGPDAIDVGSCNLTLLNAKGSFAVTGASSFSFLAIAGVNDTSYMLDPCKPLVVCSEPMASESEYKDIWGDLCDKTLGGYDANNHVIDNVLLNSEIDTIQITCGGQFIDYLDYTGVREAIRNGMSHGKLKSSDLRPWPGRTTVDLYQRMDVDATYDVDAFASPVCKN